MELQRNRCRSGEGNPRSKERKLTMNINVEMTVEEFNDYQEYLKNGKKCVSLEEFLLSKGFEKKDTYTMKSYTPNHLTYVTKFKYDKSSVTIETDKFVDPFGLKKES